MWKVSDPVVGAHVISIHNHDEDGMFVGTIKGFEDYGKPGGSVFPIIESDDKNNVIVSMGIVIPYSDEMVNFVQEVGAHKAWTLLRDIGWFRTRVRRGE